MIDVTTETLLTIPQAARRLGKTARTVYTWCRAGLLESVILGRRLHTSMEALERFARPGHVPAVVTPAARSRANRRARERLREIGVY